MNADEQIVKGWIEELVEKRLKETFLAVCGRQDDGSFSTYRELHDAFHIVIAKLLREEVEKHQDELREMLRERIFEATKQLHVEWQVGNRHY